MAPYKSPGVDGIYPVLLQRGLKYISTPLVHIYRASIALEYGDPPGLPLFPSLGSPIMLLLKHLDQSASLPSY